MEYEDTTGKKFNTQLEASASNTALGTNPSVITADSLTPVTPLKLPETTPTTPTEPTLTDATSPELKAEREKLKAEKSSQESGISSLLQEIGVTQGKEADYATAEGADIAQKEYDQYSSELEAEKLASRRKVEELQRNNPRGRSQGAINSEIDRINRESYSKQADIAILGNAALKRYDTALSIARRKVENELAPLQAELDARKFIYENNKDLFSKAELSKLDTLIKADEKKIADEDKKLTTIENIKIEATKNGLKDLSGFSKIKTVDEALQVAGSYLATPQTDIVKLDNGNTVVVDKRTGAIIKNLGGGAGTTNTATQFSALVNTVSSLENTVAGKKSVQDQMNTYLKNQDYTGAYNQIANTVAQGLPASIKDKFEGARVDREVLKGFKDAMQQFKDVGGDTGLLKGSAENISRKLLGVTGDPALTSLAVQLEREFQSYRQAMTGAAFTPAESREYAAVNPTAKKSFDLNIAVIDGALAQLDNRVDGTIKAKVPQASDILKLTQIPKTTEEVKQKINSFYQKADEATINIIDSLYNNNKSDADIYEYLQIKKLIP